MIPNQPTVYQIDKGLSNQIWGVMRGDEGYILHNRYTILEERNFPKLLISLRKSRIEQCIILLFRIFGILRANKRNPPSEHERLQRCLKIKQK